VPGGVKYLALIRGINVGGKNLVKMADLRAAFEEMGHLDVATFIASGNVIFRAARQSRDELATAIESHLGRRFGTELKAVLLTDAQLRAVIEGAPDGFGAKTDRSDVVFLRNPLTVKKALARVETRDGVDSVWEGPGVLYFARLKAKASSSRLSKIAVTPEYKNMTIRSWSTTKKLRELMESSG
jgi:uncharacterized protein (DUF1697 family)